MKMRTKFAGLILALLVVSIGGLPAAHSEGFAELEKFYQEGKYKEAQEGYRKLLAENRLPANRAAFFYNLSLAEMRLENLGSAYGYLLQAGRAAPYDSDIKYNLEILASKLSKEAVDSVPSGLWGANLPKIIQLRWETWAIVATLVILGFLIYCLRQSPTAVVVACSGVLAIPPLALAVMLWHDTAFPVAVAVSKTTTIRSGPAESFSELGSIPEGTRVGVEERRSGWAKVAFYTPRNKSQETVGWINTESLLEINN